ncbi:hypothetical protein BLNAU_11595 [Blattamonas nauphoetae]|uniref:Uncharacterized protein n=1 Tax=Blattamonas nauphoetae TaxID=2049346 RepID=A0ABQ9XN35_9EUKA|nr:hypothetical protein BLNAU_11595 [Blattamonas nauphoetae]
MSLPDSLGQFIGEEPLMVTLAIHNNVELYICLSKTLFSLVTPSLTPSLTKITYEQIRGCVIDSLDVNLFKVKLVSQPSIFFTSYSREKVVAELAIRWKTDTMIRLKRSLPFDQRTKSLKLPNRKTIPSVSLQSENSKMYQFVLGGYSFVLEKTFRPQFLATCPGNSNILPYGIALGLVDPSHSKQITLRSLPPSVETSKNAPSTVPVLVVNDNSKPARLTLPRTTWSGGDGWTGLVLHQDLPSYGDGKEKLPTTNSTDGAMMEIWVHPCQLCTQAPLSSQLRFTVESYLSSIAEKMGTPSVLAFTHDYRKKLNVTSDPAAWTIWEAHLTTQRRDISLIYGRRSFLPPYGNLLQDIAIITYGLSDVSYPTNPIITTAPSISPLVQTEPLLRKSESVMDRVSPAKQRGYLWDDFFVQCRLDWLPLRPTGYFWFSAAREQRPSVFQEVKHILKLLSHELTPFLPFARAVASRSGFFPTRLIPFDSSTSPLDELPVIVTTPIPITKTQQPTPEEKAIEAEKEAAHAAFSTDSIQSISNVRTGLQHLQENIGGIRGRAFVESKWIHGINQSQLGETEEFCIHMDEEERRRIWGDRLAVYLQYALDQEEMGFNLMDICVCALAYGHDYPQLPQDPKISELSALSHSFITFLIHIRRENEQFKHEDLRDFIRTMGVNENVVINESAVLSLLQLGYIQQLLSPRSFGRKEDEKKKEEERKKEEEEERKGEKKKSPKIDDKKEDKSKEAVSRDYIVFLLSIARRASPLTHRGRERDTIDTARMSPVSDIASFMTSPLNSARAEKDTSSDKRDQNKTNIELLCLTGGMLTQLCSVQANRQMLTDEGAVNICMDIVSSGVESGHQTMSRKKGDSGQQLPSLLSLQPTASTPQRVPAATTPVTNQSAPPTPNMTHHEAPDSTPSLLISSSSRSAVVSSLPDVVVLAYVQCLAQLVQDNPVAKQQLVQVHFVNQLLRLLMSSGNGGVSETISVTVAQILKTCADTNAHCLTIAGTIHNVAAVVGLIRSEHMKGHPQSPALLSAVAGLIWSLAVDEKVRDWVVKSDGFRNLANVLKSHCTNADVVQQVAGALLLLLNADITQAINLGVTKWLLVALEKAEVPQNKKMKFYRTICSCLFKLLDSPKGLEEIKSSDQLSTLLSALQFLSSAGNSTLKNLSHQFKQALASH